MWAKESSEHTKCPNRSAPTTTHIESVSVRIFLESVISLNIKSFKCQLETSNVKWLLLLIVTVMIFDFAKDRAKFTAVTYLLRSTSTSPGREVST